MLIFNAVLILLVSHVDAGKTSPEALTKFQPASKDPLPKAPYCGLALNDRIAGGDLARIDEFPWVAQILYSLRDSPNTKESDCGGTLINHRYVITAAHCVYKIKTVFDFISVRLGEWDTSTNPDCDTSYLTGAVCNDPYLDVPAEEVIVHEKFNEFTAHNDIALVRLSKYVNYTKYIKPLCLPVEESLRNLNLAGKSLDATGWGATKTLPRSVRKLKVDLRAYSNSDCERFYRTINEEQLCAGGHKGKNICNRDTGGPLMRFNMHGEIPHYFLAGIVSYGTKNCGKTNIPGVFTRVSEYMDWIQSKIRD